MFRMLRRAQTKTASPQRYSAQEADTTERLPAISEAPHRRSSPSRVARRGNTLAGLITALVTAMIGNSRGIATAGRDNNCVPKPDAFCRNIQWQDNREAAGGRRLAQ